jgi:ketosteroid isomerase-like protein
VQLEGEELIRKAYAAFAARDLEALKALSAEEIEVSTVTGLLAGRTEPYRGYEGLAAYIDDISGQWKRLELQPQHFLPVSENRFLVFGRVRAWHERGFLDSENAWLWQLRDDRVVSVRVYADPAEARRAFADSG